jgi:hypothetical protein
MSIMERRIPTPDLIPCQLTSDHLPTVAPSNIYSSAEIAIIQEALLSVCSGANATLITIQSVISNRAGDGPTAQITLRRQPGKQ